MIFRVARVARVAAATMLLALAGCAKPTAPQVQGPFVIDIPEYCTVCIEVLRCEGPVQRVAYVMHEQGAWAQIATIWNYFAEFFRPKVEDFRKLTIYELAPDMARAVVVREGLEARLDVWNRRVELPEAIVDQKTGAWLTRDGINRGQCTHLPRGPDRQFVATLKETSP